MDAPSFNWLIKPGTDKLDLLDNIIKLSNEFKHPKLGKQRLLIAEGGYCLEFMTGFGNNCINPDTGEGAGEILAKHGYLPILYFVTLKQRVEISELSLPLDQKSSITFCDEVGSPIQVSNWKQLLNELTRMGLNCSGVRTLAESIEFVEKVYRLDEIEDESLNSYF